MAKKKKEDYKITFKKFIGHLHVVNRHRFKVFCLCVRAGIPLRGLLHDLSKYSFIEFWEGVKYFSKDYSPIITCKKVNGYSEAWLHHKGRNKHHLEYWVDPRAKEYAAVVPYKYVAEMACDKMAASIIYNGKNWTQSDEYNYWLKEKEKTILNPKVERFFDELFKQVKENGLKETYTRKNLKKIYKTYCIDDKTKYICKVKTEWKVREE